MCRHLVADTVSGATCVIKCHQALPTRILYVQHMWQVHFLLCGLHLYPKHLSTSNSMFLSAPSSLKVEVIPAICPKKLVNILVAMIEPCWKYEGQRPPIRPWEGRVDQSEPESLKQEQKQNSRILKLSTSQVWNNVPKGPLYSKSYHPKKAQMLGSQLYQDIVRVGKVGRTKPVPAALKRLEGRSSLMFSHSKLLSSKWARAARGRVESTTMRASKGLCEKGQSPWLNLRCLWRLLPWTNFIA